jgi:HD-like signal output (HDOD) protein
MALMKQFFKDKIPFATDNTQRANLSLEILNELIPIRNLSEEELQSFALENKAEIYPAKSTLFKVDEPAEAIIFLVKGIVTLTDKKGYSRNLQAATAEAKFPLSSGNKYTTTALAKTEICILRVSPKIMSLDRDNLERKQFQIPEELAGNQVLEAFAQHYLDGQLEIPTLSHVAAKLRNAMQNDIGVADAAQIVQMDPVISAKLIQVANCPLYVTSVPAKTCLEAINRIGLNASRNLVVSLSIRHTFTSHSPIIKKFLQLIWKRSVYVSGIAYVLASLTKQVNPEEALLAGLICDIGTIPFLTFAANLPSDYFSRKDLELALPHVSAPVGSNILQNWEFPVQFIDVAQFSTDWFHSSGNTLDLTDIVLLSRLHSAIGSPGNDELPLITSIPAASKLEDTSLTPENSLHILHDAKHKINAAMHIFSS